MPLASDHEPDERIPITPEMIEAGLRTYEEWEEENIFQEEFATPRECKRELVCVVFKMMAAAAGSREPA